MPFVVPETIVAPSGGPQPPPMNQFAADAYAYLEPVADQDAGNGYVLAALIAGLGMAFDQVEQVARARPGRQPYQQVYDIDECPDFMLGWLGQLVGVPWTSYTDAVAKRQQVRAETGLHRGSTGNIEAAVAATQTADRVTILERNPDAWSIGVAYDPAYTPNVPAATAAARASIPWGLALTVTSVSQPLFEQAGATRTFEGVAATVTFESAVLSDLS